MEYLRERVADGGGALPDVFLKVMSAENEPYSVLIREAVQNSWDARADEAGGVTFELRLRMLSEEQLRFLRNEMSQLWAPDGTGHESTLPRYRLHVLEVRDSGTRGLEGHESAAVPFEGTNMSSPFARFVRQFGATHDIATTKGGSFGVGKSVFFSASSVKTLVVYTRSRIGGIPTDRLIAYRIGKGGADGQTIYTGREYWGGEVKDEGAGYCAPVTGEDAARMVEGLGFEPYTGDQCGLCVMVLDPLRPKPNQPWGDDQYTAFRRLVTTSVYMNCWPRMLDRSITFKLSVPRQMGPARVETLGEPAKWRAMGWIDEPLAPFVEAYRAATDRTYTMPARRHEVKTPKGRTVGFLGVAICVLTGHGDAPEWRSRYANHPSDLFKDGYSHIALMRHDPGLIVTYEPWRKLNAQRRAKDYPRPIRDQFGFAGVFVATDNEFVRAARLAEPPAHDTWEHPSEGLEETVPGYGQSYAALLEEGRREVIRIIQTYEPQQETGPIATEIDVAGFADQLGLGTFDGSEGGRRPERDSRNGGEGNGAGRASLTPTLTGYTFENGARLMNFSVNLPREDLELATSNRLEVVPVLQDGRSSEQAPHLLVSSTTVQDGAPRLEVSVRAVPEARVGLEVRRKP